MMMGWREVGRGDSGESSLDNPWHLKRHRSSEDCSRSLFDSLSEGEVVEILKRLPLKLAIRCKCVSKFWLHLISSNYFGSCYIRFRKDNGFLPKWALINIEHGTLPPEKYLLSPPSSSNGDDDDTVNLSLHDIIVPPCGGGVEGVEYQYLAASNGLVLCSKPLSDGGGDKEELCYIVDPLTKHWVALPPIPTLSDEPCRFGFIRGSNTSFRVVRVPPYKAFPNTTLNIDIYSSETGTWTVSSLSSLSSKRSPRSGPRWFPLYDNAIAYNGKLHWVHLWFASEIFAYDPYHNNTDQYRRLPLPKDSLGKSCHCFGTCCCGGKQRHLKYGEWHEGLVKVWELNDYDTGEWCLLHRVHVSDMVSLSAGIVWPPVSVHSTHLPGVLVFDPYDGDLMTCYYKSHFLQYNMRRKTVDLSYYERGHDYWSFLFKLFVFEVPFWPTLFPPIGGGTS